MNGEPISVSTRSRRMSSEHMWTVNDISPASELHAPLYGQALYNKSGSLTLQLAATDLPYEVQNSENPVTYKVGSTSELVAFSGGFPIYGGVAQIPNQQCAPNTYVGVSVGSHDFWSTSFNVSPGQNGNVLFLLKTRALDCAANEGPGTVLLRLKLDGQLVGSYGDQQFTYNNTCHQRTLAASYLAMHPGVGTHTVSGTVTNSGMPGLAIGGDLGLVYFGN